ncbi:MAG: hypothetical protein ACQJCO_07585 [cyanobacterium endosymbiont of Rhopalodia sterrenbergii]
MTEHLLEVYQKIIKYFSLSLASESQRFIEETIEVKLTDDNNGSWEVFIEPNFSVFINQKVS